MALTALNLLFLLTFISLLPLQVSAFGAGDIPEFSYLNNRAFRHGDIENILSEIAKTAAGGGILQFAHSVIASGSGGSKFSKADIKKVYFGNWLRDYSQAMDIGGLAKLSKESLILVVAILGFMSFGFSTEEFEVTPERLGVYLPVEHIDNPKGYAAEVGGDARRVHPKLRPPVNPQELEIDPATGMKNYMAAENRGWDTSTAHIRRTLRKCIEHGRRSGGKAGPELWEAYRLLGTALHTLEDLLAHSNWCEVALRKMGYSQVFCHVGDRVIINTPNGRAPPLVTGTFGSADFLHSLMGEATDHLSQASVTDLSDKMNAASGADQSSALSTLKSVLAKIPLGGGSSQMGEGQALEAESKAYRFDPKNVAPPEVRDRLLALLAWRDNVYRSFLKKIEAVPGLESLIDNMSEALNTYVYTILTPWLVPILKEVTSTLGDASKTAIDSADQYEVFNSPNASDPTHSLLSKDHFALILNEPAGRVAQVMVQYTVKLIVQAWCDDRVNPDEIISQVLEAFHHPYFNVGRSRIQDDMFRTFERWANELEDREHVIRGLTKEGIRSGRNKREGSGNEAPVAHTGSHSENSHRPVVYEQALGGLANVPSQGEKYKAQTSYYQQGPGGVESPYGEGNYFQGQTDYGRNQREERHTPPRHAAAAHMEGRQTIQDSYTRGERRGNEDPRQASFGRPDSYERFPEPSVYGGGFQSSYGRAETEEGRRPYEQQSTDHERRHGEHCHPHERHEHRHADEPEGRRHHAHRHEHEEESRQGYGAQAYPRPGDEYRYPGETHTSGGERPYQGGYDEYGVTNRDRERQGGYGGGGYGPPGEEYERAPPPHRFEGSDVEGYGGRGRGHGRNEDSDGTLGFERLSVQGRDEDHSERQRHHGRLHRHD